MARSIWICWISFVLLVIRDAVENLLNSSLVNPMTFRYTSFLKSWATVAATRAEKKVTSTEAIIPSSASRSILPPVRAIYPICIRSRSIPCASYSCCTKSTTDCSTIVSDMVLIFSSIDPFIFSRMESGRSFSASRADTPSGSCIIGRSLSLPSAA